MNEELTVIQQSDTTSENKMDTIESASSSSAMVKESFSAWLSDGHAKMYSPGVYLSCIDKVSAYLTSRKILIDDLWQLTNFNQFKSIYDKVVNDKLFRAMHKKTHATFVQVGQAFLKFLKSKPTIHKVSAIPIKPSSQPDSHLTIKESIIRVLENEHQGMTVEQIYYKIIADGLYSFGAQHPLSVVRVEIDRACANSNYTIRASKDCFRFERNQKGEKVYFLLLSTLTDDTAQPSIIIGSESAEPEQASKEPNNIEIWNDSIERNFQIWMKSKNYASSTARGYCSAINQIVQNFKSLMDVAVSESPTTPEAVDKFVSLLHQNTRFITAYSTAKNQYNSAVSALYRFFEAGLYSVTSTHETKVDNTVLMIIEADYKNGFMFNSTSLRLLSEKANLVINVELQNSLKRTMFHRNDNVYFLPITIAGSEVLHSLIKTAEKYIDLYECFECTELYNQFGTWLNENCIRDILDFEDFFNFLFTKGDIRCVGQYGTRIARKQGLNLESIFSKLSKRILEVVYEAGGTISENDLKENFQAFSVTFLAKIIKKYTDELIRIEINSIVCYQTLNTLGLSDAFSATLTETLIRFDELGLTPTEDALHTALSFALGVNFKEEYNIPDNKTYRRLIAAYYKGAPKREWQGGTFAEVLY
ncbi:MAG: Uncharacterized protein XD78_2004 [Desulfotomaculum sp. 46_296]|nr:MAG: Uncharacterized protein XD78_2004 [Desulfotomaculum sp. 46_296]